MKRLATTIVLALLFSTQVWATISIPFPGPGMPSGTVPDATITYRTQTSSASGLTTYTFVAVDIGTASADRVVLVAAHCRADTATAMTSVTIGGVSAPIQVQRTGVNITGIASLGVAAGTTATIEVIYNNACFRAGIGTWATTGLLSATATFTGSSIVDPGAVSSNISAGGVAVGAGVDSTTAANCTWTNLTENYDVTIGGASNTQTGASAAFATTQTGLSIQCDWATFDNGVVAVAAFR